MDAQAFNACMDELCAKLEGAFPDLGEIRQAREIARSSASIDSGMPARVFADRIAPYLPLIASGDWHFLDAEGSPLEDMGLAGAWSRMHAMTRGAVLEYIVKLVHLAGVSDAHATAPPSLLDEMPEGMPPLDPATMSNIFNIAKAATSNMTDDDARMLLETRDPAKLGQLCFSILDSLSVAPVRP